MEDKIFTIVNPAAANGKTGKAWPGFAAILKKEGIDLKVKKTRRPREAIQLAREACQQGYQRIMAVGGDGTINEVVNGLFQKGKLINPDMELIIFSRGTGCDYIKSIGLGNSIEALLRVLKEGEKRFFDLITVTYVTNAGEQKQRYFVNLADLGLGAETIHLVNRSSKFLGGFFTHLLGALVALIRHQSKVLEIQVPGQEIIKGKFNSVMVANGSFLGGGIQIAPRAKPADGLMDVLLLKDLGKLEIIANLAKAYRGQHLSHPKVEYFQTKKLQISSPERVFLEMDGEDVSSLDVEFSILEKKLPLLVLPK